MNQHSEESDDQKVALFFPKVPSIIRELSIIIFGVTFLVGGFGAILFWLPKLQTAIALKLEDYQAQLFHALDILLTAGLLSGGSDGIHQVTRLYQDRVDKFKKL